MIKQVLVVGAVAISVGGCGLIQKLGVSQQTITDVQQAAVAVCGFLPTVETVASIVSSGASAGPAAIADLICKAVVQGNAPSGMQVGPRGVPTAAMAPVRAVPPGAQVNGVAVQGKFVR